MAAGFRLQLRRGSMMATTRGNGGEQKARLRRAREDDDDDDNDDNDRARRVVALTQAANATTLEKYLDSPHWVFFFLWIHHLVVFFFVFLRVSKAA